MNKLQQANLKSAKLRLTFFNENTVIYAQSPLLKMVVETITDLVTEVDAQALIQINNLKGMTEGKTQLREVLVKEMRQMAGPLAGYFSVLNMPTQEKQALKAMANLSNRTETEVYQLAEVVYNLGKGVSADLAKVNLSGEQLDQLKAHAETYETLISERQLGEAERTTATARIDEALKQIMFKFSHQVDQLMKAFSATAPELYAAYEKIRQVDSPGRRHRKEAEAPATHAEVTFTFIDHNNLAPIEGVTVEENGVLLADTSDTDGELYLDEVKPGINNYRFIGPQHKAKSFATPAMEAGEEYNYQIELEAEG